VQLFFETVPIFNFGIRFFLPPYSHRQLNLFLWVFFGADATDAAIEKVIVAHIEEEREALIVATRDVAEEEVLSVVVEDDLHGLGVVAVVGFTFQAQRHSDTQFVPNKIRFMVFAARPADGVHQPDIFFEKYRCFLIQ